MTRPTSKHPTELELEILKVLWRLGPLPVKKVRKELVSFRKLAHSSVTTIMNIMLDKGYLEKAKTGQSYTYSPLIEQRPTTGGMLKDLLNRAFSGSASALVMNLLDDSKVDQAELSKIKMLLDERRKAEK